MAKRSKEPDTAGNESPKLLDSDTACKPKKPTTVIGQKRTRRKYSLGDD